MLLLALLVQAATPAPPADPLAALHGIVVDNIRNCPKARGDEIAVCSRDRGYAESYRLPKNDPRFEHPVDPPIVSLDAPPNPCSDDGTPSMSGCSLRDYQAWLALQRAREEKARAAKRTER